MYTLIYNFFIDSKIKFFISSYAQFFPLSEKLCGLSYPGVSFGKSYLEIKKLNIILMIVFTRLKNFYTLRVKIACKKATKIINYEFYLSHQ